MGAQLNIKSEDAYRLASHLSELTGESLTTVVTEALREPSWSGNCGSGAAVNVSGGCSQSRRTFAPRWE